jgi:hypothetical protein
LFGRVVSDLGVLGHTNLLYFGKYRIFPESFAKSEFLIQKFCKFEKSSIFLS